MLCILLLVFTSNSLAHTAGIINNQNFQEIVNNAVNTFILFHHPHCYHSREIVSKFEKKQLENPMYIANCHKEPSICIRFNISYTPSVICLNGQKWLLINPYQFLGYSNGNQKLLSSKIEAQLEQQSYSVVVFEHEGMPVPITQRIQGVHYLNPSVTPALLFSSVAQGFGCWILSVKDFNLLKYYCGSGQQPSELIIYLNNFKQGKLKPHQFQSSSSLTKSGLSQFIIEQKKSEQYSKKRRSSKIIYIYEPNCNFCIPEIDLQTIHLTLQKMSLKAKAYSFDMSLNELPQTITINAIPTIVLLHNGVHYFDRFINVGNLEAFLKSILFSQKDETQYDL